MSDGQRHSSVGAFVDPPEEKKVNRSPSRPPVPLSPRDLRWRDDTGEQWEDDTEIPWYVSS